MTPSQRNPSLDEQATYWFLRLRDEHVSPEEIEAALDWEEEDPSHAAALARVEAFWRSTDSLPRPAPPEPASLKAEPVMVAASPAATRRRRWNRPIALAAALMVMMVLGGVLGLRPWWPADVTPAVTYSTAIGENRSFALADGSTVSLSGASSVSVRYSARQRQVVLAAGEALFKVANDPGRPFTVEALGGGVRAVGTAFNVHRREDRVVVTVVEGVVQVEPQPAGNAPPAMRLDAGYQLSYFPDGGSTSIQRVSTDMVTAWQTGKLFFFDSSLEEIVFDLNRYSASRIVVDSERAKNLRFSGMVEVDRIDEWLAGLQRTSQVRVVKVGDQTILTHTFSP